MTAPVEVIKERGGRVYLMPDHASALALAADNGGTVERRNLWAVIVKEKPRGDK